MPWWRIACPPLAYGAPLGLAQLGELRREIVLRLHAERAARDDAAAGAAANKAISQSAWTNNRRAPYASRNAIGNVSPFMTKSHIAIEAANVTLSLGSGAGRVDILRGIDLEIVTGESVALLGPSGSGKSSLMAVLSGLERASGGSVRVAGADRGVRSAKVYPARQCHARDGFLAFVASLVQRELRTGQGRAGGAPHTRCPVGAQPLVGAWDVP